MRAFPTRRAFLGAAAAAAVASGAPENRPNVLLIEIDDFNDWVLRLPGHPKPITPHMDRLRKQSVTFTNAHAAVPVCGPSRKCMFSGWYPQRTQDWDFRPWAKVAELRQAVPIPLHFRENGYSVYGAGKLLHEGQAGDFWTSYGIGPDYGPWPWRGEGRIEYTPHPAQYLKWIGALPEPMHRDLNYGPLSNVPVWPPDPEKRWPGASGWHKQSGGPFRYHGERDRDRMPDEVCSEWAAELLAKRHDKPFFVGAGLIRPHSPLYAPDKYFERFPLDRVTLPPYLENDLADCASALRNRWAWGFQKFHALIQTGGRQAWKEWVQAYLACISFADDQVGRMLDALDRGPNRDNTVVVLTGDNGYHVGEKDCIQKWHLWEESTHVPLFIRAPGCAAGTLSDRPVSHIDIYPTLVELCGLPAHPHRPAGGAELDGHSLTGILRDPKRGKWQGPPVALTSISDQDKDGRRTHYSVRSRRHRYTLCQNGEEELYNHETDPNEWTNRATDPALAKVKSGLRKELERLVKLSG